MERATNTDQSWNRNYPRCPILKFKTQRAVANYSGKASRAIDLSQLIIKFREAQSLRKCSNSKIVNNYATPCYAKIELETPTGISLYSYTREKGRSRWKDRRNLSERSDDRENKCPHTISTASPTIQIHSAPRVFRLDKIHYMITADEKP